MDSMSESEDMSTKDELVPNDDTSSMALLDDSSQQSESQLLASDAENFRESTSCSQNCYCDRERDLSQVELQCHRCLKWFHSSCIQTSVGKCLKFMTNYSFCCKDCNTSSAVVEAFQRRQTNFSQMCETALANLMDQSRREDRVAFSKDREIIPFIEQHWEVLTTMPRRIKQTWHNTVVKTMAKENEVFICDNRDPNDPHFALRNQDLLKIGPNYESAVMKSGLGRPLADSSGFRGFGGRGAKRKFGGLAAQEGQEYLWTKKQKSELSVPKLPQNGFPAEYPYNKDGYRYVLAEPDPHGPHRQEFEESQDLAGKPIPGWLCRKLMADRAALSLHDRAMQLKISEDRRLVTGEKGYCMVRANYGANRGNWFFEVKVEDMPDGAAVRLGWAQEWANIQAPLGYDKFGYSFRSRKGTKFHDSRGLHYSDEGFSAGDVMGFYIELPHNERHGLSDLLPQTYKDKPLVKFKSYLYFEEKDDIQRSLRELSPLPGSRVVFYKNGRSLGTAFRDIYSGTYFPAASLYRGATVSLNFGPKFQFPPKEEELRSVSELVFEQQIEQTVADLVYLVQNEGKLRLDIFYGN